jgi:hypothetical protein
MRKQQASKKRQDREVRWLQQAWAWCHPTVCRYYS